MSLALISYRLWWCFRALPANALPGSCLAHVETRCGQISKTLLSLTLLCTVVLIEVRKRNSFPFKITLASMRSVLCLRFNSMKWRRRESSLQLFTTTLMHFANTHGFRISPVTIEGKLMLIPRHCTTKTYKNNFLRMDWNWQYSKALRTKNEGKEWKRKHIK